MKDFLGRELSIGDECIYLKNCRTGSSTTRKLMFKGVITGFKGHRIIFGDYIVYTSKDVVKVRFTDD